MNAKQNYVLMVIKDKIVFYLFRSWQGHLIHNNQNTFRSSEMKVFFVRTILAQGIKALNDYSCLRSCRRNGWRPWWFFGQEEKLYGWR